MARRLQCSVPGCSLSLIVRFSMCPFVVAFLLAPAACPASPDSVALAGIAHVALRVNDVPRSREFYRSLGFEQAFELESGGAPVSYVKINDRQFIELYGRSAPDQPLGLMHVCFDVDDLESLSAAYVKRGLAPADKRKARAGNLLFNLRDPEGQLLEYTQYLPGSLHWNERGKHLGQDRPGRLLRVSVAVKDIAAAKAFYTTKLGFEDRGLLRLPGESGHGITLEPVTPNWKPRLEFAATDSKKAAAPAADPDGNAVAFTR
jgi:catechol 2,3-dioxygenase-like lactoylglutathione lyase family enzyme